MASPFRVVGSKPTLISHRPLSTAHHGIFRVKLRSGKAPILEFDPLLAGGGERTVLGGLKTKNVDVVVTREGIGPVLAVSCKVRNLTNRMEETIGIARRSG